MGHGFTGREALCCLAQLLGLDCMVNPALKEFNDSGSWLKTLGPDRANRVGGYVRTGLHTVSTSGYRAAPTTPLLH
jgi:hypothetical protein